VVTELLGRYQVLENTARKAEERQHAVVEQVGRDQSVLAVIEFGENGFPLAFKSRSWPLAAAAAHNKKPSQQSRGFCELV
jgi:hypothetical protein